MKIIRYKNPDATDTTTLLVSTVKYNDTEIEVADSTNFSINDFILIEDVGHEKSEIVKITNIAGNLLEITALTIPHSPNVTVTKLNYDKFRIEKSTTETGSYVLVEEGELEYANPHNIIYYIDQDKDASDSLFYKISYYNSHTDTSDEQTILHKEENYGYITVDVFRQETGFDISQVSSSEIERAIYSAAEWIKEKAFVYHEFDGPRDEVFHINSFMEFADWNSDGSIDEKDLIIYEFDPTTLMRRYLANKVIKTIPKSKKVFFSEKIPININNQLVIKIPMTFRPMDEIRHILINISKLIGTNYLLANVDTSSIKGAITSWNAGGVSVNRDLNALQTSIEKNNEAAKKLMTQICKTYMRSTKLRSQVSSLNYRQRYSNRLYGVSQAFTESSRRW